MKFNFRTLLATASVLIIPWSQADAPRGVSGDLWADLVLGHVDFNQATPNEVSPLKVMNPGGTLVDRSVRPNRIYVYDGANSRVLGYRSLGFCTNNSLQACTANSDCGASICKPTLHKPADIVLGQPSDASGKPLDGFGACNRDGNMENYPLRKPASASTLCSTPEIQNSPLEGGTFASMAVDGQGNFYMPDPLNNRVLKFIRPFDTDTVADDVWGQDSFAGNRCNKTGSDLRDGPNAQPTPSASSICLGGDSTFVSGVDIDNQGNLWVADASNNRVLRFPNLSGQIAKVANLVLGQPDFTSFNAGGGDGVNPDTNPNPNSFELNKMRHPGAVRVSPQGKVFVADSLNNRVITFSAPFSNGMSGQLFGSQFNSPNGVEFDPQSSNIWISDTNNYMLELWNPAGTTVTKVLFKDTYQPNGQCGSMTPGNTCPNPTASGECFSNMCDARGSIGIDVDGNIFVAASNFVQDMWRYSSPIPSPSLGSVYSSDQQFFRWPHPGHNLRNAKSLWSPRGIAVKNNQVIISDGNKVSFWNNPTSLTNGKDADGFIEVSSFIDANPQTLFRIRADNQNHLWVPRGSEVDVYQLPLTSGAPAIKTAISSPLPVLGGGQITWDFQTAFSGIDIDPTGQFLWLTQGSVPIHRVIRVRNPFTNPVVDVILGQANATSTFCNRDPALNDYNSQGGHPPGAKLDTLCRPGGVRLDSLGNVWVSDYSLEFHGNERLLEFNASQFSNITTTALFGPNASFESVQIKGWEPAFNSKNHMVIGYDGQTSPPGFPGIYLNPLSTLKTTAVPDMKLKDFFSHGYAATFDDNDNLYVADLNRGRVLFYQFNSSSRSSTSSASSTAAFSKTIEAEQFGSMSGIQTEATTDTGGGLNVGWIDRNDWMAYDNLPVDIPATGLYTVEFRTASLNGGGMVRLEESNGLASYGTTAVPSTGGWQNWQTTTLQVTLTAGTHRFKVVAPEGGWNLNWFRISAVAGGSSVSSSTSVSSSLVSSSAPSSVISSLAPSSVVSSSTSSSSLAFTTLVQAESFSQMSGIQTEATSDTGGGLNVGWIDTNDWLSFSNSPIDIPVSGLYDIEYRVASANSGGSLDFEEAGGSVKYGSISFTGSGGWQVWKTVKHQVTLTQGTHRFGIKATSSGWNLNWFRVTKANP